MKLTPDGAQKMIKKLEQDKAQLEEKMSKLSTYTVGISEGDPTQLKPEFDFDKMVKEISKINNKIIKIKHAKNVFNATTIVPEIGTTVDMCLLNMALLSRESGKYIHMGNALEKERMNDYMGRSKEIEYKYTNYDIEVAKQIGEDMLQRLYQTQEKLNLVNSTFVFEVEL